MKFIVEGINRMRNDEEINKNEWKETSIERNDIVDLLNNTKKLADMYSEVMKTKREGWERILKAKMRREKEELEKNA